MKKFLTILCLAFTLSFTAGIMACGETDTSANSSPASSSSSASSSNSGKEEENSSSVSSSNSSSSASSSKPSADDSSSSKPDDSSSSKPDDSSSSEPDDSSSSEPDDSSSSEPDDSSSSKPDDSSSSKPDDGGNGDDEKPDYGQLAKEVVTALGNIPQPWAFLPESFAVSNKTVSATNPVLTKGTAYANFVNITDIPVNYIGKQLNVVYGVLNTCDTALGYVSIVHAGLHTIEQAYQLFLNDDPDNFAVFEGSVSAFSYKIELNDKYYTLTAAVSGVEVFIFGDASDGSYGARVQITENNVLKYEVSEDELIIAWNLSGVSSTQVRFVNEKDLVKGYIYEFLSAGIKMETSTYLEVGEDYTTVVGTKGDFIPSSDGRNCEVYDNATGNLVGTEVKEVMTVAKVEIPFDTCWYNLRDIAGLTSVKKVQEEGLLGSVSIFVNGSNTAVEPKKVGGLSTVMLSRRFDIEFKEVCAYIYDETKEKYSEVVFEVPMLFIQEGYIDSFSKDFAEVNGGSVVTLQTSSTDKTAVNIGYHTLVEEYKKIQTAVTQADIIAYCAKKTK